MNFSDMLTASPSFSKMVQSGSILTCIHYIGQRMMVPKAVADVLLTTIYPVWYEEHDTTQGTPLLLACSYQQEELALAMLETGFAHENYIEPFTRRTAFQWACFNGLPKVAMKLLDMGARTEIADFHGYTAKKYLEGIRFQHQLTDATTDDDKKKILLNKQKYLENMKPVIERLC